MLRYLSTNGRGHDAAEGLTHSGQPARLVNRILTSIGDTVRPEASKGESRRRASARRSCFDTRSVPCAEPVEASARTVGSTTRSKVSRYHSGRPARLVIRVSTGIGDTVRPEVSKGESRHRVSARRSCFDTRSVPCAEPVEASARTVRGPRQRKSRDGLAASAFLHPAITTKVTPPPPAASQRPRSRPPACRP